MELRLKKAIADAIGVKYFVPFGIDADAWRYRGSRGASVAVELDRFSKVKLQDLEALLTAHAKVRGVAVLLRDLATYREAQSNVKGVKPRTVHQFFDILCRFLATVPGHRIYARTVLETDTEDPDDDDAGAEDRLTKVSTETIDAAEEIWLAYYVDRVEYTLAVESGDRRHPAYCTMYLLYDQFGGAKNASVSFYEGDCRGLSVVQALSGKGYWIETDALRAGYLKTLERFTSVVAGIGTQYVAIGIGVSDVDGNADSREDSWYFHTSKQIEMVRNGEPAKVVLDCFYEDPKTRRDRAGQPHVWFWANYTRRGRATDLDDDDEFEGTAKQSLDEMPDDDDTTDEKPIIEIPIHPWVVVFDLAKHLRLRVHVEQLTDYIYDRGLINKLVLSEDRKSLIKILIESKQSTFRDIVRGKSGGSVVLLTGPPGVGKTLTAEVYAESEGRALYSIQCSQLGVDPSGIEDALLKTFARARRWNAVMLLDEADVYVHERGNNLQQNAIVGVFLRVLEYQSSVLFLTTNRPQDVDDAIASRCIARLNYETPSPADQERIWRILADGCGVKMSPGTISAVVEHNPHLSGRDVKNLLKLARVLSKGELQLGTIEFVKKFKATGEVSE